MSAMNEERPPGDPAPPGAGRGVTVAAPFFPSHMPAFHNGDTSALWRKLQDSLYRELLVLSHFAVPVQSLLSVLVVIVRSQAHQD